MEIHSKSGFPAGALSNFAPHSFVFDGVECASMEGLLQSFKFNRPDIQVCICKLVGIKAKKRGWKRNRAWQRAQTLWWKGVAFKRTGVAYQDLLNRAFDTLSQNDDFQKALLATGSEKLEHSIGYSHQFLTILTEEEFCSRLMNIRNKLQSLID